MMTAATSSSWRLISPANVERIRPAVVDDAGEVRRADRPPGDPGGHRHPGQGPGQRGAGPERRPVGRVQDDVHDHRRGDEGDRYRGLAGEHGRDHEDADHRTGEPEPDQGHQPAEPGHGEDDHHEQPGHEPERGGPLDLEVGEDRRLAVLARCPEQHELIALRQPGVAHLGRHVDGHLRALVRALVDGDRDLAAGLGRVRLVVRAGARARREHLVHGRFRERGALDSEPDRALEVVDLPGVRPEEYDAGHGRDGDRGEHGEQQRARQRGDLELDLGPVAVTVAVARLLCAVGAVRSPHTDILPLGGLGQGVAGSRATSMAATSSSRVGSRSSSTIEESQASGASVRAVFRAVISLAMAVSASSPRRSTSPSV